MSGDVGRNGQVANRESSERRIAAEILFCLDQLHLFRGTRPEHAWLWKLRSQVVQYIVRHYALGDLARGYDLSDEEKDHITRTERLLQPPGRGGRSPEPAEVQKVRAAVREKLRGLTIRRGGTTPAEPVEPKGLDETVSGDGGGDKVTDRRDARSSRWPRSPISPRRPPRPSRPAPKPPPSAAWTKSAPPENPTWQACERRHFAPGEPACGQAGTR